jgi:hypothetical protein
LSSTIRVKSFGLIPERISRERESVDGEKEVTFSPRQNVKKKTFPLKIKKESETCFPWKAAVKVRSELFLIYPFGLSPSNLLECFFRDFILYSTFREALSLNLWTSSFHL